MSCSNKYLGYKQIIVALIASNPTKNVSSFNSCFKHLTTQQLSLWDVTKLHSCCQLAVDKNYHTACPRVLYRANDKLQVFPKLHLDQVDHKHVYVALRNQVGYMYHM